MKTTTLLALVAAATLGYATPVPEQQAEAAQAGEAAEQGQQSEAGTAEKGMYPQSGGIPPQGGADPSWGGAGGSGRWQPQGKPPVLPGGGYPTPPQPYDPVAPPPHPVPPPPRPYSAPPPPLPYGGGGGPPHNPGYPLPPPACGGSPCGGSGGFPISGGFGGGAGGGVVVGGSGGGAGGVIAGGGFGFGGGSADPPPCSGPWCGGPPPPPPCSDPWCGGPPPPPPCSDPWCGAPPPCDEPWCRGLPPPPPGKKTWPINGFPSGSLLNNGGLQQFAGDCSAQQQALSCCNGDDNGGDILGLLPSGACSFDLFSDHCNQNVACCDTTGGGIITMGGFCNLHPL